MALIVQKYGGTSVGTVERIHSQEASLDKVFTNVTGHRLDQVEPVAAQ